MPQHGPAWFGRRKFLYNFLAAKDQSAMTTVESASVPIDERTVYTADTPGTVQAVQFTPYTSSTLTNTETMAWHLLILKRGGGAGTYSTTYTATAYVAGLSSGSDKAGTHTNSWSTVANNVGSAAPNPLHMGSAAARTMARGDVITAQVLKGSGTATDSGAEFKGGLLTIIVEEDA